MLSLWPLLVAVCVLVVLCTAGLYSEAMYWRREHSEHELDEAEVADHMRPHGNVEVRH